MINQTISVYSELRERYKEHLNSGVKDLHVFDDSINGVSVKVFEKNSEPYMISSNLDVGEKTLEELKKWFLARSTDELYFYFLDRVLEYPAEEIEEDDIVK